MVIGRTSKEVRNCKVRGTLPFWAKELLAWKDEAESQHKVHEISEKEDA